jgi:hypothetical protein
MAKRVDTLTELRGSHHDGVYYDDPTEPARTALRLAPCRISRWAAISAKFNSLTAPIARIGVIAQYASTSPG